MQKKAPYPVRVLQKLWRALSFIRSVFANLLFLLLIVFIIVVWLSAPSEQIPDGAALVLNPDGDIVEQRTEPFLADTISGRSVDEEVLLRDVIDVIDTAASDPRISAMVLDPRRIGSAGISKLQDIGAALLRFKEAGKTIVAYADAYSQPQFFLAAHADRVYLNPLGHVWLDGYGVFRSYYKAALEKLMIDFHVFRVGSYKSAMEPFIRNDMSDEAKEANTAYLNVLWQTYKDKVATLRDLEPVSIDTYVNGFSELLARYDGDAAVLALSYGLIDGLKTRDALRSEMIEMTGRDEKEDTFKQVGFDRYLNVIQPKLAQKAEGPNQVGIIVARGIIMEGKQPPGRIGSDSLSSLLRQARQDDSIRAVVLRIDSGGGSAMASEIIRREIEMTRASGKPVIVSMGSVAASGGYWMAVGADEIWASPTTLTGSIGIFAAFPTLDRSLEHLGIQSDGVGTTRLADAFDLTRPLNPLLAGAIEQTIRRGYQRFIDRVAEGRQMSPDAVENIARGRIWSGKNALAIGLVDHLGGLEQAIEAAARRVNLDEYGIKTIEMPLSTRQQILRRLQRFLYTPADYPVRLSRSVPALVEQILPEDLTMLLGSTPPQTPLAYCLSCRLPQ
jgi:protease-4